MTMRSTRPVPSTPNRGSGQIGMAAAVSIGIGGMVGAGIFSILGVVAQAAGNAMWLAFAIGGVVALLSTYSYAKLGATFPSAGGAVHFLVKSFGDGVLAGGLNLFMWAGYIISLALYATAFGSYAATFVTTTPSPLLLKSLAVAVVVLLTVVNAFGAKFMGRSETVIVVIKVAILVLFAGGGSVVHPARLSLARAVAGDQVDPVRRRRAVHRLRGLRPHHQCRRRHAQSAPDAAARALHQRDPGDHHLPRRFPDRDRQSVRLRDRARQGLCAGRGRQAVPGRIRLPVDRDRRAVLDRLRDQRHAVWLRQRLLHDRPRRRVAGRPVAHRMEAGHRRAAAHRRRSSSP